MVNQNDILKALQEGQDAGTIAQQMTDALNAAIAQKKKIDADKAKTEQEKKMQAARKEQIMQDILNSIFDFIDEFYPDFAVPAELEEQMTAAAVIESMDKAAAEVKELVAQMKEFEAMLKNSDKPKVKANETANTVRKPAAPDKIILDFLRSQGLA
jgi:hypothetical protein